MKIISWNINGIRAVHKKDTLHNVFNLDILCFQEIRAVKDQFPEGTLNIKENNYLNSAEKGGYAGTSVMSDIKGEIMGDLGFERFDNDGRIVDVDYPDFRLINVYMPQGGRDKENLGYKLESYNYLISHMSKIKKPVILLGDMNIAHQEIDLERPKDNKDSIMFTKEERGMIDRIIELGFDDTFRLFNKEGGNYSWWPYYRNARERNIGWRIDYIFTKDIKVKDAFILNNIMGSDHCPIGVEI